MSQFDKGDVSQENDALDASEKNLKQAFESLNAIDDLKPSEELDDLILGQSVDVLFGSTQTTAAFTASQVLPEAEKASQKLESLAAEEVAAEVTEPEDEKSKVTDLSFRRKQLIEETSVKGKSLIPKWAMPMGLAATVLLSFGVVTRVLDSPEFEKIGTEQSTDVFKKTEDSVASAFESLSLEESELAAKSVPAKRMEEAVTVAKEKPQDISLKSEAPSVVLDAEAAGAGFSIDSLKDTAKRSREEATVNKERKDSERKLVAIEIESDSIAPQEDYIAENSEIIPAPALDVISSNVSIGSGSDDGNIEISKTLANSQPPPSLSDKDISSDETITVKQTSPIESEAFDDLAIIKAAPSIDDISSDELENVSSSRAEAQAAPVAEAIDSEESLSSPEIDEIILGTTKVSESAKAILLEVAFEDRQCRSRYDCALVALQCFDCDCLESVNVESLYKYDSEFTVNELTQQCTEQNAECILNYCQAKLKSKPLSRSEN